MRRTQPAPPTPNPMYRGESYIGLTGVISTRGVGEEYYVGVSLMVVDLLRFFGGSCGGLEVQVRHRRRLRWFALGGSR